MKQQCSLFLAAMIALSLAACGNRTAAPAELDPVPPASESVPDPGTSSAQPEPVGIEGADCAILDSWQGDRVTVPKGFSQLVWEDRLLLPVNDGGAASLWGLDLAKKKVAVRYPLAGLDSWMYEARPVPGSPGSFRVVTAQGFDRVDWGGTVTSYLLPESLRGTRRSNNGFFNWDALPEQDLLVWSDGATVYRTTAAGEDPQPILSLEENRDEPDIKELFDRLKGLPEDAQPIFMGLRLMNNGRTLAADYGSPQSQNGHDGLALLDLSTGEAAWYGKVYGVLYGNLTFLDDTAILAGLTRIDAATGETATVRHDMTAQDFYGVTGDFVNYYGTCRMEDGTEWLTRCKTGGDPEFVCPFPEGMTASVVASNGGCAVCWYETAEEEGLLLITLPE